eukprot:1161239-Pelagomonas_calceolata.AAC.2
MQFKSAATQGASKGSAKHALKCAPFLHLKCAYSQPLHLIENILAQKCSWRFKLPEHMLRFVCCPVCLDKLG